MPLEVWHFLLASSYSLSHTVCAEQGSALQYELSKTRVATLPELSKARVAMPPELQ